MLRGGQPGFTGAPLPLLGVTLDGQPLLTIDADGVWRLAQMLHRRERNAKNTYVYQQRIDHTGSGSGSTYPLGVSPDRLDQARWALVVNAADDAALIEALWPLVVHRMREMGHQPPAVEFRAGESAGAWVDRHTDGGKRTIHTHWGVIPPVLLYQTGQTFKLWSVRHGVSAGSVYPIPYYLALVGRPGPLHAADQAFLPISFQRELDLFFGVGRICFTGPDGLHLSEGYRAYAERIVALEQHPAETSRVRPEVAYFAPRHGQDAASELCADNLVLLLSRLHDDPASVGVQGRFAQRVYVGEQATRASLDQLLSGGTPPAILFAAGHSLGLRPGSPQLPLYQGALVSQEWPGFGPLCREHLFAGEDVGANAVLDGMFAVLVASHSVAYLATDEFISDEQEGPLPIVGSARVAQLPQQLLLRGALGVLGRSTLAWAPTRRDPLVPSRPLPAPLAPSLPFTTLVAGLLQGRRAGDAMDQFSVAHSEAMLELLHELEEISFAKMVEPPVLAQLWADHVNAQDAIWLGDPACRLLLGS